jgi:hypothetical protein
MMETTIPTDLLELKARFDQWRTTRQYNRQPMPAELRQAAVKISRRYPQALLRRVLKIDPWRLNRLTTKKPAHATARKKRHTAFFKLPHKAVLPEPVSVALSTTDCRLQLERPDGSRLTLTLPALDLVSARQLCADFLRGSQP